MILLVYALLHLSLNAEASSFRHIIAPPQVTVNPCAVSLGADLFEFRTYAPLQQEHETDEQRYLSHIPFVDWSENEVQAVSQVLQRHVRTGRLDRVLSRVSQLGHQKIYRAQHAIAADALGNLIRPRYAYASFTWALPGIILYDNVFYNRPDSTESDVSNSFELYLLHEIAHGFDGKQKEYSMSRGFLDAVGWARNQGYSPGDKKQPRWKLRHVDVTEYLSVRAEIENTSNTETRANALALSRASGQRWQLPTTYAAQDPEECFAEIFAYLLADPAATSYLRPEVVTWFNENVFL